MNNCYYALRSVCDISGKESKQKAKHAAPKPRVELSPGELTELVDIPQMTSRMQATLEHLQMEYVEQLSLRTSVGILDKLPVNTPDGSFPLIQLGQVIQKSPQLIIIDMTGLPQYIGPVKDAILNSGMNLNPQQDGTSLFVPVPAVTREYRENLSKNAKMLCDKTKVKLRNIQNQYTKELNSAKRKHEASTELIKNLEEHIHFQTKQFSEKAEQIMHQKQQELLNN